MPATGALIEMAAECGGTTPANGSQHFDMLPTEPVAVSFDESLSRSADDIGHLQRRPAHLFLAMRLVVQMDSESKGLAVALRRCIARCT